MIEGWTQITHAFLKQVRPLRDRAMGRAQSNKWGPLTRYLIKKDIAKLVEIFSDMGFSETYKDLRKQSVLNVSRAIANDADSRRIILEWSSLTHRERLDSLSHIANISFPHHQIGEFAALKPVVVSFSFPAFTDAATGISSSWSTAIHERIPAKEWETDEETMTNWISINDDAGDKCYLETPETAISYIAHELHHDVQMAIVSAYEDNIGGLGIKHPLQHDALILRTNIGSYVDSCLYNAYMAQPFERDAFYVGNAVGQRAVDLVKFEQFRRI